MEVGVLSCKSFFITLLGFGGASWAEEPDEQTIRQLKQKIEEQQNQLDDQSKALQELKQQVEELSKPSSPTPAPRETDKDSKPPVRSANDKVSVTLYGQLNRAVLYTNDGEGDSWYFVDNDNSSTRIGMMPISKTSTL